MDTETKIFIVSLFLSAAFVFWWRSKDVPPDGSMHNEQYTCNCNCPPQVCPIKESK